MRHPIQYTRQGERFYGFYSTSADHICAHGLTEAQVVALAGEWARQEAEMRMRVKLRRGVREMRASDVTKSARKATERGRTPYTPEGS